MNAEPHPTVSMNRLSRVVVCAAIACITPWLKAQDTNTNSPWPDSPSHARQVSIDPAHSGSDREVTWRSLPGDFLRDQKAIWLFPVQLAKGHYWLPTLAVAGGTAGLIFADPHVMPYFRSHSGNLDDVNDVFDAPITSAEVILLPASLMISGYARHDPYQVGTALLAGEAYADAAVVDLAIKAVTRRKRPSDVAPGAPFTDTFFSGGKSPSREAVSRPGTPPAPLPSPPSWPPATTLTAGCRGLCMALPPQ